MIMKYLALIALTLFALIGNQLKAYSEEEILSLLRERIEKLDPDRLRYSSAEQRKEMDDFIKKHQVFFDSLGKDETLYYIKILKANKNPSIAPSVANYILFLYKKHHKEYDEQQKIYIESSLRKFSEKGLLPPEKLKQIDSLREGS